MQTFLFTDIEGSSRLWNRAPVPMAAAVHQQESLLRAAIEGSGGSVFKTVGDGVYAVFAAPVAAVRAAVAAQRALVTEPWTGFDDGDSIRVRMALHTGEAEAREGDYFGPTLNRLSRLLAAGHGGQVLCTDATLGACGDEWPPEIGLRDLGLRTLRDVPGSGRIFQLVAAGMPEHFPPLDTLDPRVHNLPRWPSAMVGREADADRLRLALRPRDHRMVTVLGTGGVGKTRLATEVAVQVLDEFQDGIRFVDLSALRDDAQVLSAIMQVTGAADPLLAPRDALLDWLRDRELLLVLDNCEQVAHGVASICSDIQQSAPRVTVLATSRVPTRIRGERQLTLDPLPLSDDSSLSPAVRLFAQRAQEVSESFTLSADNAGDVADICRSVDGLPLGIELAAAWVRILSPEALQRRLGESRAILRDGARDLPDRQRALASTIAWSYELLEPDDQRAFRRLAVFRGGIAVDAAAAVIWEAPVSDPLWALSRLDALVQASLLQVSTDQSGEPRFLMLQTVQEFALGILRDSGEWEAASLAHAEFFMKLAAESRQQAESKEDVGWLHRLDLDLQNLDAAIEFAASSPERQVDGLRMVLMLDTYLDRREHVLLERHWYELTYRDEADYPPELRIEALLHIGNTWHSDPLVAGEYYRRSINVAEAHGETDLRIRSLASLSRVTALAGDYVTALANVREVLDFGLRESNTRYVALGYHQLAHVACEAGMYDQALSACKQSRIVAREIGDDDRIAWNWVVEARVYGQLGDAGSAAAAIELARARFTETGDDEALALCHLEHALAFLDTALPIALDHLVRAVEGLAETVDAYTIVATLEGGARALTAQGEDTVAGELIGTAQRLREHAGIASNHYDARAVQRVIENGKQRVGSPTFEAALERGRSTTPRAALERFITAQRLLV